MARAQTNMASQMRARRCVRRGGGEERERERAKEREGWGRGGEGGWLGGWKGKESERKGGREGERERGRDRGREGGRANFSSRRVREASSLPPRLRLLPLQPGGVRLSPAPAGDLGSCCQSGRGRIAEFLFSVLASMFSNFSPLATCWLYKLASSCVYTHTHTRIQCPASLSRSLVSQRQETLSLSLSQKAVKERLREG